MKNKLLVFLILTLCLCSVFSQSQKEKQEQITLRFSWWGGDTRHQATIAAIERYMELNPNITIEYEYMGFDAYYQKLLTQLAGGTAPDISSIDYKWIGDLYAQDKPFINVNDIRDKIDLSNFDQNFLENYCSVGNYLIGFLVVSMEEALCTIQNSLRNTELMRIIIGSGRIL